MSLDNFDFKFSQCFGDKADIVVTEADIITSVEFDRTGKYLATGDKGGRVVLFERNEQSKKHCEYKFMTEFQSHDAEFDYLKSLEIEEKINQIKWCNTTNNSHFLLSTNDKTIKLWKIYEKNIKLVSENNLSIMHNNSGTTSTTTNSTITNSSGGMDMYGNSSMLNNDIQSSLINNTGSNKLTQSSLRLPKLTNHDKIIAASPKRIYSNAHTYHINSISPNSDGETFLSCDDLRINLWSLDIPDQSFNIVDIKPANMEELTEVITSAEFHPQQCNYFMYASSKGTIKLCDMRQNALCDYQSKIFEEYTDPTTHNFFTEITSSISDVKFSPDGRYIASRDYLTVKIWDINMDSKPVKTIHIHDQLKERLSDTYENDAIFDKFEVAFSGDSKSIMTGSYNNNFMIYPGGGSKGNNKNTNNSNNNTTTSSKNNKHGNKTYRDRDADDYIDQNIEQDPELEYGGFGDDDDNDDDDGEQRVIRLQADKNAFKSANKHSGSHSNNINKNNSLSFWGSSSSSSASSSFSSGGGTTTASNSTGSNSGTLANRGSSSSDVSGLNSFNNSGSLQEDIDYKKSILHFSWHPHENSVAIAATNNLFIFSSL